MIFHQRVMAILALGVIGAGCSMMPPQPRSSEWTILYYCDADNNLDSHLMADIVEMQKGLEASEHVNLIALVDRSGHYASDEEALGEVFEDTRLYRVLPYDPVVPQRSFRRLDGGEQFPEITQTSQYEADMGQAATLRKFIEFGKAQYPAEHYSLVMSNHGGGARALGGSGGSSSSRLICQDETDGGILYTAEMTDVLDANHSVDLLVFDACLMGTAEIAYQYSPGINDFSADYILASSPTVWVKGLEYEAVMRSFAAGAPDDGRDLGMRFLEAQSRDVLEYETDNWILSSESFVLLDNRKIIEVKGALDRLVQVGWAAASGESSYEKARWLEKQFSEGRESQKVRAYFSTGSSSEWIQVPHFDLYQFADALSDHPDLGYAAHRLRSVVDEAVVRSFGGSGFGVWNELTEGLGVVFPDGDLFYNLFESFWWYHPEYTRHIQVKGEFLGHYGNLAWCRDGSIAANGIPETWFELLDAAYDDQTNANGYEW